MTAIATQPILYASDHGTQLRKAVIASTIGTAIEWYDFFIYGIVAGLVFGKLYFPNEEQLTATLAAFTTFFIGFVGRPIGAAIFGHFGDRIGRKATLVATLLCTGIATFLIALVPTYESVGMWGAVILTLLRTVQGIGVGGEWGGSVLLTMEWSRHHGQRGLVAAWPQIGAPCGLFLANLAILASSTWSGDQFPVWAGVFLLHSRSCWLLLAFGFASESSKRLCSSSSSKQTKSNEFPFSKSSKSSRAKFCSRHCFGRLK